MAGPLPLATYDHAAVVVLATAVLGLSYAAWLSRRIGKIDINTATNGAASVPPLNGSGNGNNLEAGLLDMNMNHSPLDKLYSIFSIINAGAHSFLYQEYRYLAVFTLAFAVFVLLVVGFTVDWSMAGFTVLSFVLGASTSVVAGLLGMKIAVFTNGRVAYEAMRSLERAFDTAFRGGLVMGLCLVSLAVLDFFVVFFVVKSAMCDPDSCDRERMAQALAGFGMGASFVALFQRVGGGIYTKAADVGADLVGKVEAGIPEDDSRNPATIADNVGDNVGNVAGMGADLFGSLSCCMCAVVLLSVELRFAGDDDDSVFWGVMLLPVLVSSAGIVSSLLSSLLATTLTRVKIPENIKTTLKWQQICATIVVTPLAFLVCYLFLPDTFTFRGIENTYWKAFGSIAVGLWGGLLIGLVTEYWTAYSHAPVQELANSCTTGSATNILYGLSLGYMSVLLPTLVLSLVAWNGLYLTGMYGIALVALGMLSTLCTSLCIATFGAICDNAGGIAEMAGFEDRVRERTNALEAAGNSTAAIGRGFAVAAAMSVGVALLGAFTQRAGRALSPDQPLDPNPITDVALLNPYLFAGLVYGSALPLVLSSMTIKAVGRAAYAIVEEVRAQFTQNEGIMTGECSPNYARCISLTTEASLREVIAPALLLVGNPIVCGFVFGTQFLTGLLTGALLSGVQMAASTGNAGMAWDSAKRFLEAGGMGQECGKGSDAHVAAVIGDTVGDPLKDTSAPAINILMKFMAMVSLVFADSFLTTEGGLLGKWLGAGLPTPT